MQTPEQGYQQHQLEGDIAWQDYEEKGRAEAAIRSLTDEELRDFVHDTHDAMGECSRFFEMGIQEIHRRNVERDGEGAYRPHPGREQAMAEFWGRMEELGE